MQGIPSPALTGTRSVRAMGAIAGLVVALVIPPAVVAAAVPTSVAFSAGQSTIVAGDRVALTAAITPGPGGGAVNFTSSLFGSLGTASVDPGTNTAAISTTLAPGTHSITATFSGFNDFTGSTGLPITVTVTAGTAGGTPTTTSVTLGTPGAAEGDLADLRATVGPAPDDGRVQFMEGNRLLGTAPIDAATGQAVLPFSGLTRGTHQIVAIYNGSAAFSGSISPSTPVFIGADVTVQATGIGVSHATIYPITDGVGDTVTIRGRTQERTSTTIAVINRSGNRVRAKGLGTVLGAYAWAWDGRTSSGKIVAAGKYNVVQTLIDLRGNRLVVSTPLTVSLKNVERLSAEITRAGAEYDGEGTEGFGLVIPLSNDAVHVYGNQAPDWAFISYTFKVPSAMRYRLVTFEVTGEAQPGRSGAVLALLDASGEPAAEARTGTTLGRYAVSGANTAVNDRTVTATVTANGATKGSLRVYSVRLIYSYEVFR